MGSKVRSDFSDVADPATFELPSGDAVQGQKLFKKHCAQCHSIYPDNRILRTGCTQLGPTLFNVYGRASGERQHPDELPWDRRLPDTGGHRPLPEDVGLA